MRGKAAYRLTFSARKLRELQRELRTDQAIGERLGVPRAVVEYWRRKLDIPSNRLHTYRRNVRLRKRFAAGESPERLSTELGLPLASVLRIAKSSRFPDSPPQPSWLRLMPAKTALAQAFKRGDSNAIVGARYRVPTSMVAQWRRKLGILLFRELRRLRLPSKRRVLKLQHELGSDRKIGVRLGVSEATVRLWRRRVGVCAWSRTYRRCGTPGRWKRLRSKRKSQQQV